MSQREFQQVKVSENAAGGPFATVLARRLSGLEYNKEWMEGSVGAGGLVSEIATQVK